MNKFVFWELGWSWDHDKFLIFEIFIFFSLQSVLLLYILSHKFVKFYLKLLTVTFQSFQDKSLFRIIWSSMTLSEPYCMYYVWKILQITSTLSVLFINLSKLTHNMLAHCAVDQTVTSPLTSSRCKVEHVNMFISLYTLDMLASHFGCTYT